ncbi:hypothetical protein K435DRAFT_788838 [Dendrothele bispora CBS 962.96]|uniref:Uncharacterized protein n=1 Tax=Dendrothele bispora (strain CBS 962.96) TaxID=1314807 RepID=A0A4S8MVB4_DENBC|nr:hypothetical protein K435DRAFT_788838 [Dendrothele bispora CBS 962.96]
MSLTPYLPALPVQPYYSLLPNLLLSRQPLQFNTPGVRFPGSHAYSLSSLPPSSLGVIDDSEIRISDLDHIFYDDAPTQSVYLVVHTEHGNPRERHWAIRWLVYNSRTQQIAARCLEVLANYNRTRLINWGPFTNASRLYPSPIAVYDLGSFTASQRQELEKIGWNIPVPAPDGYYNCQNWVAAFLGVAVARGLIRQSVVVNALQWASQTVISNPSRGPFPRPPPRPIA